MSVEEIQSAIVDLPSEEFATLLEWIEEYRAETWDRQNAQKIAQKVRERLAGVMPGGVTLSVVDADVYRTGEYWLVPVNFSRWPQRMSDFYEDLAIVEDDLQEQDHLNILLATGVPLEEEAEAAVA